MSRYWEAPKPIIRDADGSPRNLLTPSITSSSSIVGKNVVKNVVNAESSSNRRFSEEVEIVPSPDSSHMQNTSEIISRPNQADQKDTWKEVNYRMIVSN